jgi:hypothetical protein
MQYQLPASAQKLVDDAFLKAHNATLDRSRLQPPVAVRGVAFGQPFMLDASPHLLFARVQDDMPCQESVPVVVIGADDGTTKQLGQVIGLPPGSTVRLVDVVRPMAVRWHA